MLAASDDEQTLDVVELAPPSDEDVRALALKIARRVSALIEQRFATTDDAANSVVDAALRAAMQTRTVSRCALREAVTAPHNASTTTGGPPSQEPTALPPAATTTSDAQSLAAGPPRQSGRGPPPSTGPLPTARDWVVELDPQQTDRDWGA